MIQTSLEIFSHELTPCQLIAGGITLGFILIAAIGWILFFVWTYRLDTPPHHEHESDY